MGLENSTKTKKHRSNGTKPYVSEWYAMDCCMNASLMPVQHFKRILYPYYTIIFYNNVVWSGVRLNRFAQSNCYDEIYGQHWIWN